MLNDKSQLDNLNDFNVLKSQFSLAFRCEIKNMFWIPPFPVYEVWKIIFKKLSKGKNSPTET